MKLIIHLTTVLFVISTTFGCGSAPNATTGTNTGTGAGVPAVINGNSNAAAMAANQTAAGIPSGSQPVNTDVNAPPAGNIAMADRRKVVDVPSTGPTGPLPSVPAPENSSVTTTMDKTGTFIVTRVFKDNKFIAKVEKTSNGPRQTATIFLKNGRAVSVPPTKIPALNAITVAELMDLAGVRLPTPPAPKAGQTDETTKKGKQ